MRKIPSLSSRVEEFARGSATAVRLQDLYKVGRGDAPTRLRFARFLCKEVAVRNAQLCKELRLLPWDLGETRGVSKVVDCFSSYVDSLYDFPPPRTPEDDEQFSKLLVDILEDHTEVVRCLGEGVQEVRDRLGAEAYERIRSEVDSILDRFFMKRIGLRFLIAHHIAAAKEKDGVSGIIHNHVRVGPILRKCASAAQKLCEEKYGKAPEVEVLGDGIGTAGLGYGSSLSENMDLSYNREFTYVPTHLEFSCSVLLQNACFAVAEKYAQIGDHLPPVRAIFAYGEEEVTVKISDEGGGVSQDDISYAWSYFSTPSRSDCELGRGRRHSAPLGSRNPLGAGLPLARLHARYYGGDLMLKPIQGFGTDSYLVLNRLGNHCENLPHGVRVSPASRESSVGDVANIGIEALGDLTKVEVAFLREKLKGFRAKREASSARLNSIDSVSAP